MQGRTRRWWSAFAVTWAALPVTLLLSRLARAHVDLWVQWLCAAFLLEACWLSLTRTKVPSASLRWWRRIIEAVWFLLPPALAKEIIDMRSETWWAGSAVFVAVLVPEMLLSSDMLRRRSGRIPAATGGPD